MSTKFPSEIDDIYSLLDAKDNASTILTSDVTLDSTSICVLDTSEFPDQGIITIHNKCFELPEKLYFTSKTLTTFNGLTRPNPKTFTATCGIKVSALNTEDYHNTLRDAIIAVENFITDSTSGAPVILIDVPTGITKYKDSTRSNKWCSTSRQTLTFSRASANLNSQYLRYDTIATTVSAPRLIRNAVITAMSIQSQNNIDCNFIIRKNGSPTNLYVYNVSGVSGDQVDLIDLNLNQGDYIQVYMDVVSGNVDYPVLLIEYCWRF